MVLTSSYTWESLEEVFTTGSVSSVTRKQRYNLADFLLAALAATLFSVVGLAATSAPQHTMKADAPDRADAYYHFALGYLYEQLAVEHMNREYLSRSVEEYRAAIAADPSSGFLRRQLIELFARTNRFDDAVAEADMLLAENPDDAELLRLMGKIYSRYAFGKRDEINDELLKKAITVFEQLRQVDPSGTQSLLQLANLYRAAKEKKKAAVILNEVLEKEPNSTDALTGLAFLHLDSGDAASAIAALEKVKATGVADRNHLTTLGTAYERVGAYKKAAEVFQEVLDRGEDSMPARRGLAHNLVLSGNYKRALKEYEILAATDSRNPENHLRLSQIYRELRRFEDAHQSLQKAQALAPDSLEIKYNLVQLLEAEGSTAAAVMTMKEVLRATEKQEYSPHEQRNRAMFLEQLGMLHRAREEIIEAEKSFRAMAEISPETKPRSLLQIVDSRRAARQYMKARQMLRAARKEFPDDRALAMLQATVFAEIGDTYNGAKVLKGLLNRGPLDHQVYLSMAQVFEKGKKFDEAIRAVQKAEAVARTEPQKRAVLFTYGSVLERGKRFDEAEEKFRELLAKDPNNASALNYLGYMLADRNIRLDDAHAMIQRALDLDPNNGAYLDSLGWVYYRQNKFELAERYLRRSLEQHKRDPIVLSHLGDVYFKLRRPELAEQHWKRSIEEWERSAPSDRDDAAIAELRKKLSNMTPRSSVSAAEEERRP